MNKTEIVPWLEKPVEGYVVNTSFSQQNTDRIMELIDAIGNQYGESVFCMPEDSLHITLLDWIAPLVGYEGKDKRRLFEELFDEYDAALNIALSGFVRFKALFDTIRLSPTTIFIEGRDDGQFQQIRGKFLESVELLPDTKQPPTIIHSSLARFTEQLDLREVEAFLGQQSISVNQEVGEFRLVHTQREPMLEYDVVKTYPLEG